MAKLSIQDKLITIAHSAKSGFVQKKTHNAQARLSILSECHSNFILPRFCMKYSPTQLVLPFSLLSACFVSFLRSIFPFKSMHHNIGPDGAQNSHKRTFCFSILPKKKQVYQRWRQLHICFLISFSFFYSIFFNDFLRGNIKTRQ